MNDQLLSASAQIISRRCLQQYCAKRLVIIPGMLIASVSIAYFCRDHQPAYVLFPWLLVITLLCFLRFIHMQWYDLNHDIVVDLQLHQRWINVGIGFTALCLTFAVLQFTESAPLSVVAIIYMVIGVISTVSVLTMSGSLLFFSLLNTPFACAIIFTLVKNPGISADAAGLASVFYLVLLFYAINLKRGFEEKVRLEVRNNDLLVAEELSKQQLMDLNQELEARIEQRTTELSRVNQELQSSERELLKSKLLYEQAEKMGAIGHWEWNANSEQAFSCSQQCAEIFGFENAQALEQYNDQEKFLQLVHPDDREKVNAAQRSTVNEKSPLDLEYRIITRSGEVSYVYERSNVTSNEEGEIVSRFGIIQDISVKKLNELELLKNQTLYEQAEKLGRFGHWEWDEEKDCMLTFSEQYANIFNLTMVDRLANPSRHNRDLVDIHNEDLDRLTRAELNALKNAESLDIEYRIYDKDDEIRHIRQISDVIVDDAGRVIRTYGIVQDITQAKVTELELRKHQEMFEQAERLGRIGHWEWDEIENRLTSCSPQYADIFAMSRDQMMQLAGDDEGHLSLVHEEDRHIFQQVKLDCFENSAPMNLIYRIVTSNGNIRYVRQIGSMQLDDKGQVIRSFGTLQDITRQQHIELALRKRQTMFERAEKLGRLGHWEWDDVNDRLISCSRQYAEIFAMRQDEMLAAAGSYEAKLAMTHPDDRVHCRQMDIYTRSMGIPMEFEYRIITRDGSIRHVHQSGDVEVDKSGNTIKSFGTLQDITEQKNIELELRERQAMFEQAEALGKLGHWEWDEVADCLISCSRQYAEIHGVSQEEMIALADTVENDLALVHEDDRKYVRATENMHFDNGEAMVLEYRIVTAQGNIRHVKQMSNFVFDDKGNTTRSFGTLQDITELKDSELQIREQQEKYKKAELIGNFGHWEWDIKKDCLIYCSDQYAKIHERSVEECLRVSNTYENEIQQVHPDDRQRYRAFYDNMEHSDGESNIQFRVITGKGNVRVIHEISRPVFNNKGELIRTIGTVQDVTERVEVENKLRESQSRFKHIFENAPIGMALINIDGSILELNPSAANLIGFTQKQSTGMNFVELTHPDELTESMQRMAEMAKGLSDHYSLQRRFRHRKGHYIWVDLKCSLVRDVHGQPSYIIAQGIDITAERELSARLNYQASHDSLTNLINRRELEARMGRLIESAVSKGFIHSFCYMDLDQFKIINDTFGHAAGDELLRQLCSLIQKGIRSRDTLARLGGDEFGLLMEHCHLDAAMKTAENLRNSINEFRFIWNDNVLSVGVSMGIAPINEKSGTSDDVLRAADSACYLAKDKGRNRIKVYAESDQDTATRHSQMQWAAKISQAMLSEELYLVAQPIVDLRSRKNNSLYYELLLRLRDSNGELVSANAMLAAAERYGLTTRIDEWVVNHACQNMLSHPDFLNKLTLCSINLSGHSITDMEFLDYVENTVNRYNIPAGKICFEITETSAISNFSNATKFMERLRSRGFYFALDDFGTGLSSFAYLKKLPVDFIKIDGAFILDILNDPTDMALVKSINELGHVYGKRTIAEYVESPEILDAVSALGIDFAQGYCIGMPEPLSLSTPAPFLKVVK